MADAPEKSPKKDHRLEDVLSYQQGFMSAKEAAEFEAHLATCPACQETMKGVAAFLPTLQKALTTPEAKAVRQALAQPEPARSGRKALSLLWWLGATAAAFATAYVLMHVFIPVRRDPNAMSAPGR